MKFIGRKREMETLAREYDSKRFGFAVITGPRRTGKTSLILEFAKSHDVVAFQAIKASRSDNLKRLSDSIGAHYGINGLSFSSYHDVFSFMSSSPNGKKACLSIDEYPYLVKKDPSLSSLIQGEIDQTLISQDFMLILSGSSLSMMEREVTGSNAPLYKRATARIRLTGFSYSESMELLDPFTRESRLALLSAFGPSPYYLSHLDPKKNVKDNIIDAAFSYNGDLAVDEREVLNGEVRDPETYNSILMALSKRDMKIKEISEEIGMEATSIMPYLNNLIKMDTILRHIDYGTKDGKRNGRYRINDSAIRFYYSFVFPYQEMIGKADGEVLYQSNAMGIEAFIRKGFEEVVLLYLKEANGKGQLDRLYRIWKTGDMQFRKGLGGIENSEVDVLGIDGNHLLIAEAKWQNGQTGVHELNQLLKHAAFYPESATKSLYLFSKGGFSSEATALAEQNAIALIRL